MMEIRFGKFPDQHHFLLIARPFVEWNFKILGWLFFTSTIEFAYEKTGNQVLFYVKWFVYCLLLLFVGSFVDWVLSFQSNRKTTISGKDLVAAALKVPQNPQDKGQLVRDRFWSFLFKARSALVLFLSLLISIVLIGAANLATEKILTSFLEFQQKIK